MALLEHWVASQAAAWSSNWRVCHGPVAGLGHACHHHSVVGAAHPRRIGLDGGPDRPQIEDAPAPAALALVVSG